MYRSRIFRQREGIPGSTDKILTWYQFASRLVVHTSIPKETYQGAQWLSGRMLDLRPKGSGFEPHRGHGVVVLEQDTFILD